MKYNRISFTILFIIICVSCNSNHTIKEDTIDIVKGEANGVIELHYSDSIKGDFDGDGKVEYAWYVSKEDKWAVETEHEQCNYIEFSNPNIPKLKTVYWLSNRLINEGDLNDDGKDKIGAIVYANPYTSNWHTYQVWTLSNGEWKKLIDPFIVFVGFLDMEALVEKKDSNNVIIHYSSWENEDIATIDSVVNMKCK